MFSWQDSKTCHPFGLGGEETFIGRAEFILVRTVHPLGLGMVYCTYSVARTGLLHREITGG